MDKIEGLLTEAVSLYRGGKLQEAEEKFQQAQFDGFKNSELRTAIRLNYSQQKASTIESQFSSLILLASQAGQLDSINREATDLLRSLRETLPDLPSDGESVGQEASAILPGSYWNQVAQNIHHAISTALTQYRNGLSKEAATSLQSAYLDEFEASGMENRIGTRDADLKSALQRNFAELVNLVKTGQPVSQLEAQAHALQSNLTTAVAQIEESNQSGLRHFLGNSLPFLCISLIAAALMAIPILSGKRHPRIKVTP